MEIRYLKTFIQVAERNSFTKAAEALNYTQSTVSFQIKQLETELNTQLFERINHNVSLTAQGQALLNRAQQIINLVEEMKIDSSETEICEEPVRFAMAIVGSLQSGLSGNHEMLFTKAILDLISAIILASTLGFGVMLTSTSVLIVQGSVVLLAQVAEPYLSSYVIGEMTCAGSVLIAALALNMLGITKIKLMDMLPAIFIPIVLCIFM